MNQIDLLTENLRVDEYATIQLRDGAKWARFLAIMGFIISGIIILAAFSASTIISNATMETGSAMSPAVVMLMYLVVGGINFVISLFLYKFSTKALNGIAMNDQDTLNESFKNLKLVFKVTGILLIVYLSMIIIGLIAGIAFLASSGY